MVKKPVVLQIVGYQNSGKTTASERMIRALTTAGFKVGTLKHHGHGGKPDLPEGKDSTRHFEAGAVMSGVEGDGTFVMTVHDEEPSLEKWLPLYAGAGMDVVLVEGYKRESYNKVVCIRTEEDQRLLHELSNVIAVLSWLPLEGNNIFSIQDASYVAWVVDYIRRETGCLKS